jgi:hypothetical protein
MPSLLSPIIAVWSSLPEEARRKGSHVHRHSMSDWAMILNLGVQLISNFSQANHGLQQIRWQTLVAVGSYVIASPPTISTISHNIYFSSVA